MWVLHGLVAAVPELGVTPVMVPAAAAGAARHPLGRCAFEAPRRCRIAAAP